MGRRARQVRRASAPAARGGQAARVETHQPVLEVRDDSTGLAAGGVGLELLGRLVSAQGGRLEPVPVPGEGTCVRLVVRGGRRAAPLTTGVP